MSNLPENNPESLCQSCGRQPAVVEFIQVTGSERRQVALCRECAATHGVEGQLDAFQRLAQLLMQQTRPVNHISEEWQASLRTVCSRCGTIFDQFIHTGLLGCPQCYVDFHDILVPVLRRLHGVTKQTAEEPEIPNAIPESPVNPDSEDPRRTRLEEELHLALIEENFERAATIRDELKRL